MLSTAGYLAQAAIIFARQYPHFEPSHKIISLLNYRTASDIDYLNFSQAIRFTHASIIGCACVVMAGFVRLSCYRALGRHFTFELSILKEHKLITTGPYSVVRHPAYTGSILALFGNCLSQLTPGSWLRESGVLGTWPGLSLFVTWSSLAVYGVATLFKRVKIEDSFLKEEFGQQWVEWEKMVKFMMIPGVY